MLLDASMPTSRWSVALAETHVPTDAEQAMVACRRKKATYAAGSRSKVISTRGFYKNSSERSIDRDLVTREGYDPSGLHVEVLKMAQENHQQAAFMTRVVRPEEMVTPPATVPGSRVTFRTRAPSRASPHFSTS